MKLWTIAWAAAAILAAAPAFASNGTVKEEKPGLLKQAEITPDAATQTAKTKVPQATIESAELEEENGRVLYMFDMKTAGKSGVDEVSVDAQTGKVLGVAHETPEAEARERAADRKKH